MTSNSEQPFISKAELRDHLQEWFESNVGVSDLAEGNRRLAVVQEWRETHG